MKRYLVLLVAVVTIFCVVAPASADMIIFEDNFNSENGGVGVLNYNNFANWSVTEGTVDLIGNGYFDWFGGAYGLYVDMDGSTGDAGKMLSSTPLFLDAGTYKLSFDLAGNHRNTAEEFVSVQVNMGAFVDNTYTLGQAEPFQTFSEVFTVAAGTSAQLSFAGTGGDNIGMLLDNVKLEAVPEPATLILLGLGLLGIAGVRRRS